MFKKFKDKLAEEMKQSPARLQASMQQFAQAVVSPALSNSSIQELSASNDNFSLTEEGDETPKNSPAKHGFQNVDLISPTSNSMGISRRSSISSVTSDTSSLFPIYESPANLYHLQSDMDQSASEIDDTISPQLDKVTKDQLYSAYRKVQAKYHKYRGRYSDLATHYRELERVKGKLESVLVETQDKVLRRIADLKEQCQLEQQAKAHLEEALRNDIEEKDHIINTLNTKIKLLQTNGPNLANSVSDTNEQKQNPKDNLIDLTTESSSNADESSLLTENAQLKEKLKKLENLVLKYKDSLKRNKEKFTEIQTEKNTLESEYEALKICHAENVRSLIEELDAARAEINGFTEQVNTLKKREEECAISLAENKLSIHRELEDKEEQIKQLRSDLKHMTETKDNLSETIEKYKTELEKLKLLNSSQNLDPEKKEIIQDISRGKSEALKLMQQEMQQKLISLEEKMGAKYHEEIDRNKELSKRLEKFEKENRPENFGKLENDGIFEKLKTELHDKEAELQNLRVKLEDLQRRSEEYRGDRDRLQTDLSNCKIQCKELKSEQDAQKIVTMEKEKEAEMTIEKLQATIQSLDKELENIRGALADRDRVCENFNQKVQEYADLLEKAKEKLLTQDAEVKKLREKLQDNSEISKLQDDLDNNSTELLGLHSELKSCRTTISDLKESLQISSSKIDVLCKEKNCLIANILSYKNALGKLKEDCTYIKDNVKDQVLSERNKLSILNKTLVTSLMHLEKNSNDRDGEVKDLETKLNDFTELTRKYAELEVKLSETTRGKSVLEADLKRCNEQLKEVFVELQEKNDVNSKNCKLIAEMDNLNFKLHDLEKLPVEVERLKQESELLRDELRNTDLTKESLSSELKDLRKELEEKCLAINELESLREKCDEAVKTVALAKSECSDYSVLEREAQSLTSQVENLKEDLCKKENEIVVLNEKLLTSEKEVATATTECENQRTNIQEYIDKIKELEEDYKTSSKNYEKEIEELTETHNTSEKTAATRIAQLKKLKALRKKQEITTQKLNDELDDIKAKHERLVEASSALEKQIEALKLENAELETLRNNNSDLTSELETLKSMKDKIYSENKDLKDKENELSKCNLELRELNETLKSKLAQHEESREQLLSDAKLLQMEVELSKTEFNARDEEMFIIRDANNGLQMLINQISEKNTELRSINTDLNSQVEQLQLRVTEAQEVKENLSEQCEDLSNKILDLLSALKDGEIIKEENKELRTNLAQIQEELVNLKTVKEENNKIQQELDDLKEIAISLEKVQLQNSELVTEQTVLKQKIVELEGASTENIELQSHVNGLESKLSSLQEVETKNVELQSELANLKAAKDLQNAELTSRVTDLNVNNERLTAEVDELKATVDEKLAELKLLDTRNSDLLKEVERLNRLSASAVEKKKEVELLETTIKDLEDKINKLHSEIDSLKKTNATLQSELQNAYSSKSTDETLINRTGKLEEENKKLEAQLDEALITFQAKESQMQEVNEELKSEAGKLKEELKTSEEEQSMRLKQLVKEFQAQLQDKEEELQAALEKRFDRQQNYESSLIQQYKEQLKDFQVELTAKSEQIENLILDNKELLSEKSKDVDQLVEKIALIKKEHVNELREIERKWKSIVQQKTDKLEAKHEEEINELTSEWRNERRPNTKADDAVEELESTSRVAMAAVQSNTGSFHTLQQTLTGQRRELEELRKLVKLRHEALEDSTEIEYLRNILYEYMMGRETMVLARVIAAVVKFDQEQTARILKKEEDKMTLLGSLGLT